MFVDRREALAFLLSGITVILFIIAIIVFIKYGATMVFYVVVVLTFAAGVINAWIISRSGALARAPQRAVPKRAARRRPSGKKRRKRQ